MYDMYMYDEGLLIHKNTYSLQYLHVRVHTYIDPFFNIRTQYTMHVRILKCMYKYGYVSVCRVYTVCT